MAPVTTTTRRACSRCLFVEGMTLDFLPSVLPRRFVKDVTIDDDNVCSLCRAYERDFDRARLAQEREELMQLAQGGIVVALSGGKDSLSTLWLARSGVGPSASAGLGLDAARVTAVLLDNGFIPREVLDVARAACAKVDVKLEIVALEGEARAAFASSVAGDDASRELPCSACSRHLESALLDVAHRADTRAAVLITGTNFFASWGARPSSFTSTRGALRQAGMLPVVHLPYMLGIRRSDVERNLDALGVRPLSASSLAAAGVVGSTNCRVPGLLHARAAQRGHTIDVEDKLLEVLVGHLTRQEALV